MPGGKQIQDLIVRGSTWTQIPSPKSLQLSRAAKSTPRDILNPSLSLGMPPLPSARVRISSPVAPEGHSFPTHQHNYFLRKARFSKWGGITEKTLKVARNNQGLQMHCCPELTAFQTDSIKTWRWKEHWKIKGKSDQVFPLTSTLTFLVFLSFAHL